MKAQVQMQIIVYVLALAVTALVLIQGFRAIKSFTETGCRAELINFQNHLSSEIKSAAANHGSVKNLELSMPCKHTEVVFVDVNHKPDTANSLGQIYPLIFNSWQAQAGNVFLIPTAQQKIDVGSNFTVGYVFDASGNIIEDQLTGTVFTSTTGYVIIEAKGGRARIRIEGRAGHAIISAPQP